MRGPTHAHVRLAPLDGGVPARLGDLPGPVSQLAWSPDSTRIVVVCRVGVPDRAKASAADRNAPRVVRGLAARLDGVGWQDGRRHLFVVDVPSGSARQLTRGDYDHDDPSFSPDGATIVFASDRSARRDDRQFRGDAWVVPATGGRPRRLTNGKGRVCVPGLLSGRQGDRVRRPDHRQLERRHPRVRRPRGRQRGSPSCSRRTSIDQSSLFPGLPAPICWTSDRELLMLVADHGAVKLASGAGRRAAEPRGRRRRSGHRRPRRSARPARGRVHRLVARPAERGVRDHHAGAEPAPMTDLNDDLMAEVELAAVKRATVARPDGTEVEYFSLLPPGRAPERLPLHVEIHGGPHASWPSGRWLPLCTRRWPPPATSWSCPIRVAARATARRSRARAPGTGEGRTPTTSSPAATT